MLPDTMAKKSDGFPSVPVDFPRLLNGLFEYPAIAVLRHPLGAREMAFPATAGSRLDGVAMQNDTGHFGPIRSLGISVEQAQIGQEVRFVV